MTAVRFRIFISSPSDVFPERERLDRVIARLDGEYGGGVLEAIRWERAYYSAAKTFQDQIPLPAETDLVICILWKRLGFELPPDYRRPDGTTPTGTEFEFENAMQAARATGTPDVLVYRKVAPVLLDAEQIEIERTQFELLKLFWLRWFRSDTGHFTAGYKSFDTTDAFETAVEENIRQWLARRHVAAAAVTWPIALRGSPFRGLEAFDADHSEVFFGRRRAIERARERLVEAARRGTPFLLVLGASGSGKSSLARAGLLPRLVQPGAIGGIDVWRSYVLRPSAGDDPVDALVRALYAPGAIPELGDGDSPTPGDFGALLRAAPDAAARALRLALTRATADLAAREQFGRPVVARLLLVVDQFEEALTEPGARDAFGRSLAALLASGLVWVIATLRSDLYGLFQASVPLLELRDGGVQLDLARPTAAELGEMIEGPAAAAGLHFDRDPQGTGLDEVLTAAADQPGALPLLQLTLDALFQARDRDANLLTFAAYDALGGLSGVIERSAEAALQALDRSAQAALPDVLRALVDLTDEGNVTSRAASAARVERTPDASRLVVAFSTARLLVAETQGGERRLRVAHEALLYGWPRAAALIAADREALRARRRIEAAARNWLQEGRDGDFLLPHGRPLAEAAEFVAHHPEGLDPASMAFVQASEAAETARQAASRAAAERELRMAAEAQQARADVAVSVARNTRKAAAVVFALLLLAMGVAGFAVAERRQAQRRTAEAERNFASALGAGASLVDTANAHLADGGMSRDVAQSLLQDAEVNLGGLVEAGADAGPKLRDAQVQLLAGFSKVQLALCDSAGARARAAKAVEVAAAAATTASSAPRKLALVRALDALGQAAYADGDRPAAAAAYRRAEQVASDGTPAGDDAIRSVRRGLAAVIARTDRAAGLLMFRDDLAWQEQAAALHPDEPAILGQLASDLGRIAELSLASKQLLDTAAALDREAAILRHLAAMQPANMEWQHRLAQNDVAASRLSAARGDAASAMTQAQAAAQSAARVSAHDPDNAYWQRDVMNAQFNLYDLYASARDYPRMFEAMGPALAFVDKLTGPHAGRSCQSGAASLFQLFGRGLLSSAVTSRRTDPTLHPATDAFEKSLSIRQAIATAAPDDRAAQFSLADAHVWLARSYLVASRPEAAIGEYQAALTVMKRLLESGEGSPESADLVASLSSEYGGFQALQGKTTEALATQQVVQAIAERMLAGRPEAARWQHVIDVSQLEIGKIKAGQRRVPSDSP